jgi:hypothetical protein
VVVNGSSDSWDGESCISWSESPVSGDKEGNKLLTLAALSRSFPLSLFAEVEADFLTPFVDLGLFAEPFGRPFAFGGFVVEEVGRGGLKGLGGIFAGCFFSSLSGCYAIVSFCFVGTRMPLLSYAFLFQQCCPRVFLALIYPSRCACARLDAVFDGGICCRV